MNIIYFLKNFSQYILDSDVVESQDYFGFSKTVLIYNATLWIFCPFTSF